MTEVLEEIWKAVEQDYLEHRINSERSLQAAMYRHLMNAGVAERVFVEPQVRLCGCLAIVLCQGEVVRAFIEIKATPHFFVPAARLRSDLAKLVRYSKLSGKDVRLDLFGPSYRFDLPSKRWIPGMPLFRVDNSTWFIFAVISRYDDRACRRSNFIKMWPELTRVRNFKTLSIATNPEPGAERHCVSSLQCGGRSRPTRSWSGPRASGKPGSTTTGGVLHHRGRRLRVASDH